MNRKAEANWFLIGLFIALIVGGIMTYILYKNSSISNKILEGRQKCESWPPGGGLCKVECEVGEEFEVEGICKGDENMCCIPLDASEHRKDIVTA